MEAQELSNMKYDCNKTMDYFHELKRLCDSYDDYGCRWCPLYNQKDYNDPYGQYGTVSTHGCGITSLAMVATYLLDNPNLTPDVLAKQFGRYNTEGGSAWSLFGDSAKELGIGEVKLFYLRRV